MQAFRTLRGCVPLVAAFAVVAFEPIDSAAADATLVKRTYTYKTVGDCEIRADVYRPEGDAMRPVVVWIHGGALIVGSRQGVPGNLKALCRAEGFILVSIDYRLAPEVKVPTIIEDLQDAIRWVREKGPELNGTVVIQ
jgi:acetyl esterase/lipase